MVKNIILFNVDKVSELAGKCKTGGRLNAYKAFMNLHSAHNFAYVTYNQTYHTKYCQDCFYSELEEHSWSFFAKAIIVTPGALVCSDCGERKVTG